ncbi:MAG TPA: SDR family oxidoreductase [Usitatibacteraceae bacterium]|nr:SDR family oxidoreductase [Usitatibacteraceae bacterium]
MTAATTGRVAVITGGAGALGFATARALLEDGTRVALVDVDALRLDTLSRFVRGTCIVIAADVTDVSAVRAAHDRVRTELGPVDILVNAAGASSDAALAATDETAWRRILGARLDGTFQWSRAVLPEMTARGWGRIVNVGGNYQPSLLRGPAEAAASGAVASLSAALAREAAPGGVTVNAIAPAFVRSPAATEHLSEAQRRQALASIPAGRFGELEEFAHAVRFLASPLAGFITGEILNLDGGLHLG